MVKFAWSWADYEREKAKAERRAEDLKTKRPVAARLAREAAIGRGEQVADAEPGNVGTQGDAPCSDDCGAVTSGRAGAGGVVARPVPRLQQQPVEPQLRYCKACGKTVLDRCTYAGCPLQ